MDAPGDEGEIEEIAAEEAFSILGNETRMEILRVLWERDEPCPFAVLRDRAAPDDRGNFSYHLDKLTGHFVRKTDDGYVLRYAGEQVVRAVLSGTITTDPTIPSAETDERCLYCGASVEMAYEEEVLSVRCSECGGVVGGDYPDGVYMHYEFPPAGLADRSREEVIDAGHVLYDSKVAPMMKGVCPECAGQVSLSHDVCDTHDPQDGGLCPNCESRFEVWSDYRCENCRYERRSVMWFAALNHPAVIAFFERHGYDEKIPIRKLTWDNAEYVSDISGTVVGTDPYRFRVTIPVETERLLVELDEELDVLNVSCERVDTND